MFPRPILFAALISLSAPLPALAAEDATAPVTASTVVEKTMQHLHHMKHMAPNIKSDEGAETLVGGAVEHGFYLAPVAKYSKVTREDVALVGARGAWLLNHVFGLGAACYTTVNEVPAPEAVQRDDYFRRYVRLTYGGLVLEGIFASRKVVHAKVSALIGGGRFGTSHMRGGMGGSMMNGSYRGDYYYGVERYWSDSFFAAEPEATLEVNVAKYVRFNLSGGYRFVGGAGPEVTNQELGGVTGSAALAFGVF